MIWTGLSTHTAFPFAFGVSIDVDEHQFLAVIGQGYMVRGRRCPLLGRVTMDLIMIDASEFEDVDLGEEAVLMGRQGDGEISCEELAERSGTITWEIITRIGSRVRRVYV